MITSIRLICACCILLATFTQADHGTRLFLPLFIAAGISDMLDGHIARSFHWCTDFGAKLDSVSDLTLYIAASVFFFSTRGQAFAEMAPLIVCGAALQIFHISYSLRRFAQFPAYHSTFSRLSAYLIFFAAIAFHKTGESALLALISIFWCLCSGEGIIITALLTEPLSNLSGIPTVLRLRKFSPAKASTTVSSYRPSSKARRAE